MRFRIDLTLDSTNPTRLAEFWKVALGYQDEPPPAPFHTREEWLARFDPDLADADGDGDGAWLCDPDGIGPRLCILQVPEPKVAKNRLHLDVRVAGSGSADVRWARILKMVDTLIAAGATELTQFIGHHVVLADPEGNEFCVC